MSVATFQNFVSIETEGGVMHKPSVKKSRRQLEERGIELKEIGRAHV